MKHLEIVSSNPINMLLEFINTTNKHIKIKQIDNSISISYKLEDIESLTTCISIYTLLNLHEELLNKISTNLNCSTDNTILRNLSSIERYNPYIEPIKILLIEHLKNNKVLNIESFIRFNCRGILQDYYKIGQDYISIYNSEFNNNAKLVEKSKNNNVTKTDLVDSSIAYHQYLKELNERFIKISYKLEENSISVNYIPFEYIHLKEVNNSIILVDNNDENIEFLIEEEIPFEITDDDVYDNETLRTTILLLLCIVVFKTKTIVFHKSVEEDIVSQILLYLNDSKDSNHLIEQVNLFKCNGCDFC